MLLGLRLVIRMYLGILKAVCTFIFFEKTVSVLVWGIRLSRTSICSKKVIVMDPGRDCKKRISNVTTIMDLSSDIVSEILSKLSIKPLFCCKMVCKMWYNLLTSEPSFFNMYQQRSSAYFPRLLLSVNYSVYFLVDLRWFSTLKRNIVLSPYPFIEVEINWFV